jgi:hypothetical protein
LRGRHNPFFSSYESFMASRLDPMLDEEVPKCHERRITSGASSPSPSGRGGRGIGQDYSTVTDLARLRGWSMSQPRSIAQ